MCVEVRYQLQLSSILFFETGFELGAHCFSEAEGDLPVVSPVLALPPQATHTCFLCVGA